MRLFGLSTLAIKALNVNSHSGIYDLDGNCKYQKTPRPRTGRRPDGLLLEC